MNQFSPEQLQQLIQLGTVDEQQQGFQEQLAQAEALRQHAMQQGQHRSPLAAGIGAIGNVVGGVRGRLDSDAARKGIADALSRKTAGRTAFANMLGQPQPQPGPAPMPPPPQPPPPSPSPMPGGGIPPMLQRQQPPPMLQPGYSPFTL